MWWTATDASRSTAPSCWATKGAGVVEAVGEDVTDHARRRPCRRLPVRVLRHLPAMPERPSQPVHRRHRRAARRRRRRACRRTANRSAPSSAISAATRRSMLLHENSLVRIDPDLPLDRACLVGCGVITGVGAALHSVGAAGRPDGRGVRLRRRRAFDRPGRAHRRRPADHRGRYVRLAERDMAKRFGATHFVNEPQDDPVKAVRALTGGLGSIMRSRRSASASSAGRRSRAWRSAAPRRS